MVWNGVGPGDHRPGVGHGDLGRERRRASVALGIDATVCVSQPSSVPAATRICCSQPALTV